MEGLDCGVEVGSLRRLRLLSAAVLLVLFSVATAHAQYAHTRHVRNEVADGQAKFLNQLPGPQTLQIDLVLPLRDPAGLDSFLQEVYDPTSPSYRHFLTPQQFTERFGPTQQDYDLAANYAKAYGLKVVGGSPGWHGYSALRLRNQY